SVCTVVYAHCRPTGRRAVWISRTVPPGRSQSTFSTSSSVSLIEGRRSATIGLLVGGRRCLRQIVGGQSTTACRRTSRGNRGKLHRVGGRVSGPGATRNASNTRNARNTTTSRNQKDRHPPV